MNDSMPNTAQIVTNKTTYLYLFHERFINLVAEITIKRGLNFTVRWQNQIQHVNFTQKSFRN